MTDSDLLKTIEECDVILNKSSDAQTYFDRGCAKFNLAAECIGTSKEKRYLEEAVADFTDAIALKPDNALLQEVYRERGNAQSEMELHEEAVSDFTHAIKLTSDIHALVPLYLNRSCSYDSLGEEELAKKDHEKYEALVKVTRG